MTNNKNGFSLLEIIVAIGLLGMMSFFMMSMFDKMSELEGRMLDMLDITPLLQRTSQEFVLGNSCFYTLKQNIDQAKHEIPATGEVDTILGLNQEKILSTGERIGRLTVNKVTYSITPISKDDESFINQQRDLKVVISYSGQSKTMKNKNLILRLPVMVSKKAYAKAVINECLTYDSHIKKQVKEEIIQELNQSVQMSPEFMKELKKTILKY